MRSVDQNVVQIAVYCIAANLTPLFQNVELG